MKASLLTLALLALAPLAQAAKQVYLAESLFENNLNPASAPFCVSWANTSMPDTEVRYEGTRGTSYSCKVDYAYRNRLSTGEFSQHEQMGSRLVQYAAVATRLRDSQRLGDRLKGNFGYIIGEEATGVPVIDIFNGALHGLYGAANMLSSVFQVDVEGQMLKLTPKFNAVNDAKNMACQAISVEIMAMACPDDQDRIREDIENRARAAEYWNNLREGMLPRGRHP